MSTAIQTTPHIDPPEAGALINVIERAAMNPNIDLNKLERLIEMQERVLARTAKAAYASALAAMQQELPVIKERGGIKDRNGNVQSKYALWEDINEGIKPALTKHGFALSFRTGREGDQIVVTGILMHREGHSEQTTMHLPLDTSGSKNNVQAVGSSTSYGKRYTAGALLNLTSGGEDDDGAAGGNDTIDSDEAENIHNMLAATGSDKERFLKLIGASAVETIRSKDYERVTTLLRRKAEQKARSND